VFSGISSLSGELMDMSAKKIAIIIVSLLLVLVHSLQLFSWTTKKVWFALARFELSIFSDHVGTLFDQCEAICVVLVCGSSWA
jgi:hypothetical protein